MNQAKTATLVHIIAVVTGVLGIVAAAAPQLGIPPYAVAVVGVAITVLTYVANQVPALGADTPAAPAAPAPVAPAGPLAP